ncbi:histone-lysine N-methyltransferase SETMAR [Plakobranchus ocellatus]|uniref:Histone-lysine N-methyltransferase SETMAR n=1 Tax=Plakobranchus ocellatus TaxID=259542 RepID=A0AAV3ZSV0_9GAST|nr:histone-lysine N-methyltransferase SETMAR [Plakobranchus ocellatus]
MKGRNIVLKHNTLLKSPGLLQRIAFLRRSRVLQYRDAKGVILLDILPQGQCINAARYCSTSLHLGGMAFETEDDLISELRNWFDNLDVDFFRVGINSLLSRWQKCIDLHGDYVEKKWKSELQSV